MKKLSVERSALPISFRVQFTVNFTEIRLIWKRVETIKGGRKGVHKGG